MPIQLRTPSDPQTSFQPIGDWTPDIPSPINEGMLTALNLVPGANGIYGPEKALTDTGGTVSTSAFGDALKAHGSLHSRASFNGSQPEYYAGTLAVASGASRIVGRQEQGDWVNLSRAAGYDCRGVTPWRFANFGIKVLAACRDNALQISDGDLGTFRDVNADIRGSDVATVRGFAALIDINDVEFGDGVQPFRVWWSAIGNAENFPDPLDDEAVTVQSGFRDLFGGGTLQRIIPGIGGADAVIIAERKMWRMSFVGAPQTWQFDEIETDQGTTVPGSVVAWNEQFFYFGHNGLYLFDGANSQEIGQGKMHDFFENDVSLVSTFGNQHQIEATIDSERKCYVISYRNRDAAGNNNNRIIRFNWITQKWSNSAIACDALGHMDSFIARLDAPRMVMIDSSFQLRRPAGSTLETTIEAAELTNGLGERVQVQGVFIHTDASGVLAQIAHRNRLSETPVVTTERGIQTDDFIRWFDENPTGRFYQCRIRIPAGTSWTNITGMIYDYAHVAAGPTRSS